jgi:hypothetical protein
MKIKAKYKFKVHKKTKQNLTWEEAKAYCKSLGDGWRMPTRVELLIMYEAKEEIKGFVDDFYWSSTEYRTTSAYGFRFGVGYASFTYKIYTYSVRAVKDC